ncbi:MAG: phosphoribosylaminoimidazolesuccinocarboxamide synthase [Clostridia bacterium]|nr:phosphoribosylaminoimidazolesuccinocarboxamide synthase [Clostridia bacterium]
MTPTKEQLIRVIDFLPENEQQLLLEIAKRFLPDDVATPEDLADIEEARKEYERGETVDHSAIDWS